MKSILFVNRVFPPDAGATGRCLADLAGRMAAAGWRVTVVADGKGGGDAVPGVSVLRTGGGLRGGSTPLVQDYVMALSRLAWRAMRAPKPDVVVTMTDPPLLGCVGPMLAARHGAASIHWCQDLYPALLPILGVRLPQPLMRWTAGASRTALSRHDTVIAIGACMARRMAADGVPERKILVLPNWFDPVIHPVERSANGFRAELGLGDRFTVVYSGTVGLAHPVTALLDAAERLAVTDPDIRFLVIGEGRGLPALKAAASARGLSGTVLFQPLQPAGRLAESLSAADLHLATMDPGAEGLLVPSKVAGALAAGRPCLFLGPRGSEAAAMVEGCGLVLDPDDGPALARSIRAYARDPVRRRAEGERARATVVRWTADAAARRFMALADSLPVRSALRGAAAPGVPHA